MTIAIDVLTIRNSQNELCILDHCKLFGTIHGNGIGHQTITPVVTPLIISGDHGCGKSFDLSLWLWNNCCTPKYEIVLYHYVDSSDKNHLYLNMMDHFILTLRTKYNYPVVSSVLFESTLFQWLRDLTLQGKSVMIVIDGLDKLDSLQWLPKDLPSGVNLIASIRSKDFIVTEITNTVTTVTSNKSGNKTTSTNNVTTSIQCINDDCKDIFDIINERNYTIVYKECVNVNVNPLYYHTVSDHMRITHEKVPHSLSVDELAYETIKSMHKIYPKSNILAYISVTQCGLHIREIYDILSLDTFVSTNLLCILDPMIVRVNGKYVIRRNQYARAIKDYYLSTQESIALVCTDLIEYFKTKLLAGKVPNEKMSTELMHLLEVSKDQNMITSIMTNIELFELFPSPLDRSVTSHYVQLIKMPPADLLQLYNEVLDAYSKTHTKEATLKAMLKIGWCFRDSCYCEQALDIFFRLKAAHEDMNGIVSTEYADVFNEIGRVYFRMSDYERTRDTWTDALQIREQLKHLPKGLHNLGVAFNNVGLYYNTVKDFDTAEKYFTRALDTYTLSLDLDTVDAATSYHNLALLYSDTGRSHDALQTYNKALIIKERIYGINHPEIAMILNNIALQYSKGSRFDMAYTTYTRALTIAKLFYGNDHIDVSLFSFNIGVCCINLNKKQEARKYLTDSFRIRTAFFGPDHLNTRAVISWINVLNKN
jgi:tetratricopeptide (TPR) repeat protein